MRTHNFVGGVLAAGVLLAAFVAHADPVDNLKPGEWYDVPSSQLRALDPCPTRDCSYSAVSGMTAVIQSWSGGAYDTKRDRLLVWGGGHHDYGGNELYAFDLGTLTWSRLTNPSDPPGTDAVGPYAADGNPTSRHTYNYLQYVPALDSFCSFGGAALYPSGQTNTVHTDCFDLAGNLWKRQPDTNVLGQMIGAFSAIDPTTGHGWIHGCGGESSLAEFDPISNMWISHGGIWTETVSNPQYYTTADVDPVHHLFVSVGAAQSFAWDLSRAGQIAGTLLATTGDQAIIQAQAPGFVYDAAAQAFVGWNGGADVLTLDPTTWVWTRLVPAPSNTVTPTAATQSGTNGRFRYSPARNVFVVVNSVDEDVYIYKLSAGGGTQVDGGVSLPGADAGSSQDAGGADGGSAMDGGVLLPAVDAGSSQGAGGVDGGSAADGGVPAPRSGCACRATSETSSAGGGAWLALVTVAIALAHRRRGASRIASARAGRGGPTGAGAR